MAQQQYTQKVIDRFWPKVDRLGPGGCWLWLAACVNGYGRFTLAHDHQVSAHRVAYELLIGPIPDGYFLDHLCTNRRCCNPAHLEAVTPAESNRRKWSPLHQDATVPYIPPVKLTPIERFMAKVIYREDGCWGWTASKNNKGYAQFSYNGRIGRAYRFIYQHNHGPIPSGMVVDHICRNRECVNPAHLRLLSPRENTMIGFSPQAINARKTDCPKGHPLTGENLRLTRDGRRECRECLQERYSQPHIREEARLRSRLHYLVTYKLIPAIVAANP